MGFLLLTLLILLAPTAGRAAVILNVSGIPNSGETLQGGEAAAAAFTISDTIDNVLITAPVTCVACQGGIWLQQNSIGSGASLLDTLSGAPFPTTTSISLPSLGPGTYFLIFSVDSGAAIWQGSAPPTVTSNGANRAADFLATSTLNFAPFSDFQTVFGVGLNYTITGTPEPVAEPGTFILFLGATGAAWAAARRRAGPPVSL
jgi:hypothetical protein